jgi:Fe-S cluster biogenesis protein NfuA
MDNREFQAHTTKIDQLVQGVTALTDDEARTAGLELLQSMMDLHGAVLERVVELLAESGEPGRALLSKLGNDPLVCGLLVLYGIHPVPTEARVSEAIEKVRPQLRKQGADVELLGIADGVVRVKVQSHGSGEAIKVTVQQAILEAAPETAEIITEGLISSGFVPLDMIQPATTKEIKTEVNNYEESAA